MRWLACAPWLLLASATHERAALANGRFPDAQQLVVDPSDDAHIAVQTTYGFIITRNAGASWVWSCEQAASYSGILDPPIAIVEAGVLLAAVFDGLSVTSPDGCDYSFVGGELADRFFVDVSTLKQDPSKAIALSSDGLGMNQFDTRVWKTEDGAASFTQLGAALPASYLAFTLDAAPDDEDLVYLSGFDVISSTVYQGALAVSTDAGASWTLKPIPGSGNDAGPYIAAIDPNDHDTVYVRLASLEGQLLVTHDAGDTWETIFQGEGALLGFALSPDGGQVRVGGDVDGIWASPTSDFQFEQVNTVGVRCLTWAREDLLYACAREAFADFTVGKSSDGGITFEPLHHLSCLDGPDPSCPAGSTIAAECTGPWAAQKQILQTETCETASGGGGSGAGGQGGSGGAGTDADDDGCGCRAAPRHAAGSWLLLALSSLLLRRRRA